LWITIYFAIASKIVVNSFQTLYCSGFHATRPENHAQSEFQQILQNESIVRKIRYFAKILVGREFERKQGMLENVKKILWV